MINEKFKKILYNKHVFNSLCICFICLIGYLSYIQGVTNGEISKKREFLEKLTNYEQTIVIEDNYNFSEENFIKLLKQLNVKFPYIVMAQAYIESGMGESSLFKTNNNLFGMKEAMVRPNINSGSERGYAFYENWEHSVIDYVLWQSYTNGSKIRDEETYYEFLKQSGYAESYNYILSIKNIVEQKKLKEIF